MLHAFLQLTHEQLTLNSSMGDNLIKVTTSSWSLLPSEELNHPGGREGERGREGITLQYYYKGFININSLSVGICSPLAQWPATLAWLSGKPSAEHYSHQIH